MENIQTLPGIIHKNGFRYTQIWRGKTSCIYEQMVWEPDTIYYEVFLIKVKPAQTLFGREIPPRERFPHNEAFGYWAWTYHNLRDAKRKFNELEKSMTYENKIYSRES